MALNTHAVSERNQRRHHGARLFAFAFADPAASNEGIARLNACLDASQVHHKGTPCPRPTAATAPARLGRLPAASAAMALWPYSDL